MRKLLLIPALLFITACSVNSEQGVMQAETRKGGFMGLSTQEAVKVETEKAFKGAKDVVIASFYVGFNDSTTMSQRATGLFGGGFGGKSAGHVKLVGVDEATKQAITDAAYRDFVTKLKAQGFNVVERNVLTGYEGYNAVKKFTTPYLSDTSGLFSSYGTTRYYAPSALGNQLPAFPQQLPNETGGAFGTTIPTVAAKLARERNVDTIYASYLVNFAGGTGHGKFSTTSSVTVGQLLSVDQGQLGIQTRTPDGVYAGNPSAGKISLGQPIAANETYGEVVQTTSGAAVAAETALNIVSSLAGTGSNQSREFEFKANPAKYQSLSTDVLQKANDALISKMGSLK